MQYRKLGGSGLKVSAICLGTLPFGWWVKGPQSHAVLDAYHSAGGNFLDTADVYPYDVFGVGGKLCEEIIGEWLHATGHRDSMVIATKVSGRMGPGPNDEGLSAKHIMRAVEGSLRRLRTDYIDLYQAHDDDPAVPIYRELQAFDSLVRRGLVRYVGTSNFSAWRKMKALGISRGSKLASYVSTQPLYNLVQRADFERELQPLCVEEGIAVMPYSPLAEGFLTGRYQPDQPPPATARAGRVHQLYQGERVWRVLKATEHVAQQHGTAPAIVALAWLLTRDAVVAPIVSANSPEQIQHTLQALELKLSADECAYLNNASEP